MATTYITKGVPQLTPVATAASQAAKPYTAQDFVKANQGYSASWDPTTKTSTITAPSGQSISFASGQANSNYGVLGGLYNNSNIVDPDKLKSAFAQPQAQAQSQPQMSSTDYINQLKQAQINQNIAALDKQRSTALSSLEAERAKIEPLAYDNRNAANVNMNNSNRSWDEFLASKGLNSSGIGATGYLTNQNQYQGEVGEINRDAASQQADVNRRVSDVNVSYASDLAAAQAGAEAQALQNLMNQYNSDREFNLNKTNADRSYGLDVAGLTGSFNGQRTLAGQQFDTQNKQWQQQFGYQQQRDKVADNQWQQQFNYQKQRDSVADTHWQKEMNLNLRQQSFAEVQAKIENALAQKRINQEGANQALAWARFNADNDPNSLDNQVKLANSGMKAVKNKNGSYSYVKDDTSSKFNTNTTNTIDDFASTINRLYITTPSATNGYSAGQDTQGIKSYLDSLISNGVNKDIINSLAARYGIR